jgi:hypothetical protein
MHAISEQIVVAGPAIVGDRPPSAVYANSLALALPERIPCSELARPTGYERGDAICIRIPVEWAGEASISVGEIA